MGSLLRHKPEMVDSFLACDVVAIPGLLPIFLHGCKIKYGSGLGMRQDITKTTVPNNHTLSPRRGLIHTCQLVSDLAFFTQQLPVATGITSPTFAAIAVLRHCGIR